MGSSEHRLESTPNYQHSQPSQASKLDRERCTRSCHRVTRPFSLYAYSYGVRILPIQSCQPRTECGGKRHRKLRRTRESWLSPSGWFDKSHFAPLVRLELGDCTVLRDKPVFFTIRTLDLLTTVLHSVDPNGSLIRPRRL